MAVVTPDLPDIFEEAFERGTGFALYDLKLPAVVLTF